jgi:hypothetical protein
MYVYIYIYIYIYIIPLIPHAIGVLFYAGVCFFCVWGPLPAPPPLPFHPWLPPPPFSPRVGVALSPHSCGGILFGGGPLYFFFPATGSELAKVAEEDSLHCASASTWAGPLPRARHARARVTKVTPWSRDSSDTRVLKCREDSPVRVRKRCLPLPPPPSPRVRAVEEVSLFSKHFLCFSTENAWK